MLKRNGLWIDVPDHVKPDCYIHYVPFEERDKVLHRLSYRSRKPLEDIVIGCKDGKFQDMIRRKDYDKDFVLFVLDYTPRVVNLGFMTNNLKRFDYSRKPSCMKCPICGGDMVLERDNFGEPKLYDRPPPEIPQLYRDRRGVWVNSADTSI